MVVSGLKLVLVLLKVSINDALPEQAKLLNLLRKHLLV